MDLETLIIRVQAMASGVQAGVDEAKEALGQLDKANQASAQAARKASQEDQQAKAAQAAAYAALSAAATVAMAKIIGAIWRGVEASNAYANSLIGLRSIVEGTGNDFGAAKKFIDDFTADGLIPAADAATALKNLLARGYTDEQATDVLLRLKDAASFGRQASLSLGEAVKSAAEGLKNENSILVDNAGVTKNVAKMWEEYAKQIGKATIDLTQAEKIQAEYNGIMAETAHQVGDAAKYAAEFSGAQSKLAAEGTKAWVAFGDAMKPALGALLQWLTEAVEGIRKFVEENRALVAALVAGGTAATAFLIVLGGIQGAIKLMEMLKLATIATNATLAVNPLGWVMLGVSLLAMLAVGLASVESAAKKANREMQESFDKLSALQDKRRSLQDISVEYETLAGKINRTTEEQKRLEQIERELVTVHGLAANAINSYGEAIFTGTEALRAYNAELLENIRLKKEEALQALSKSQQVDTKQREDASKELERALDDITKYKQKLDDLNQEDLSAKSAAEWRIYYRAELERAEHARDAYQARVDDANKRLNAGITLATDAAIASAQLAGAKIDSVLREFTFRRIQELVRQGVEYADAITSVTDEIVAKSKEHSIFQAFVDSQLPSITKGGEELSAALRVALAKAAAEIDASSATLEEKKQKYADLISQIASVDLGDSFDQLALLRPGDTAESKEALQAYQHELGEAAGKLLDLTNISQEARQIIGKALAAEYDRVGDMAEEMAKKSEEAFNAMVRGMMDVGQTTKVIDEYAQQIRKVGREKALIDTLKKAEKGSDAYNRALQDLAALSGISAETIAANLGLVESQAAADEQALADLINRMVDLAGVNPSTGNILGQLQAIAAGADAARAAAANLVLQLMSLTSVTLDNTGKVSGIGPVQTTPTVRRSGGGSRKSAYDTQIETLEHLRQLDAITEAEEIARLERIKKQYAKTADEKRDIEERLYEARKAYQQKLYDDELSTMEHRKALGQLTVEQEIAYLQRILAEHAKTAEQRMEIEERLYDLQQSVRDSEVEQLDRLGDGVIEALRARYEEQKKIEQDRVQTSIDGWKQWADESKKAIQAQINALDELSETEDREAQDAAELRKIEATKQLIVYEKDAYNREQLEKELARLEEERAKRLRKNAIEDEKERLRDEMEAIDEKASAEQDALQDQMKQIDEAYAERLKSYNLQAEAERLIASNNQQEIINLIKAYAPDYEATGKTLGERLYDGFKSAVQDISDWFAALNDQIEDYQRQLAQTALDAADAYYQSRNRKSSSGSAPARPAGVTVYQENTFNTPVESPAETARRIRQTNEALAQQLLMG